MTGDTSPISPTWQQRAKAAAQDAAAAAQDAATSTWAMSKSRRENRRMALAAEGEGKIVCGTVSFHGNVVEYLHLTPKQARKEKNRANAGRTVIPVSRIADVRYGPGSTPVILIKTINGDALRFLGTREMATALSQAIAQHGR